jgi:hypothetical protein
MTSETDVANRALALIGTRSQIASLTENSNEAIQTNLIFASTRDELLRLAPWNCATNYNNLSLICAAPGTPENPSAAPLTWSKGIPPPPWSYEYAYPSDCLRPLWIVPQFSTGFSGGVPITTAVTGGAPNFWNGPPVRFKVSIDQIDSITGLPAVGGDDTRVILTNQQQAILAYIKRVINANTWDDHFAAALSFVLAGRLVFALTGDKGLANLKLEEANRMIVEARSVDGNEGLTVNDVTPDFIRIRGISAANPNFEYSPNQQYDWGGLLTTY